MSRYRKVEVRIWSDERFRLMSDRGKLAFLFLLTHPHMTGLGAMRASAPGLAAELGWTEKAFREAFTEALSKGIAKYDENACFLWLPKFLKHNRPESPNVVTSWASQIDALPECVMKRELCQHVKAFTEGLGEGFRKAFAKIEKGLPIPFAKGMPNQEQEHEQEQEHDNTPLPPKGGAASPPVRDVFDPLAVTIPTTLESPAFRQAWSEWVAYRRSKRKSLSPQAVAKQIAELSQYGIAGAVISIEQSIRNDWQGLFAPGGNGDGNSRGRRPTTVAAGPGQRFQPPDGGTTDEQF